jgi:hypothetical protein
MTESSTNNKITTLNDKECTCIYNDKCVTATFYYHCSNTPLASCRVAAVDSDKQIRGKLHETVGDETKIFHGILVIKEEIEMTETSFTFVKYLSSLLTDEKIAELSTFNDYPYLPLAPFVEKLSLPEENTSLNPMEIFDFSVDDAPEDVKKFSFILKQLSESLVNGNMLPENVTNDTTELASMLKDYKYMKMKEFMTCAKLIHPETLSSSDFLSIEILREYPKIKWNWRSVTTNMAIPIRDILNNLDLPWDFTEVEREDISQDILKSFGIFASDIQKTYEYSEFDLAMSPQDPSNMKDSEIEVTDEIVNNAMSEIIEEYPDIMKNITEIYLTTLRESIVDHIRYNGEFNLEEFEIPKPESRESHVGSFEIESTEDDPFGVRLAIETIKTSSSRKYEAVRFYREKINFQTTAENTTSFPKNRTEYLEVLRDPRLDKLFFYPEKCVFFEFEDVKNYPDVFRIYADDKHGTEYLFRSGRVTLEYIQNSEFKWNLGKLVEYLPLDYVVKNLLHYPDRIKLSYIENNFFSELLSIDKIRTELLAQDSKILLILISKRKFDYNYFIQYRDIKWPEDKCSCVPLFIDRKSQWASNACDSVRSLLNGNPATFLDFVEQSKTLLEKDDNLDTVELETSLTKCKRDYDKSRLYEHLIKTMKWDDFKTKLGFNILKTVTHSSDNFDDLLKISDQIIYDNLGARPRGLTSDMITPEIIKRNPKIKWEFNMKLDILDIFNFFMSRFTKDKKPLFALLIFYIKTRVYRNFTDLFFLTLYYIVKKSYENSENKSHFYECVVESLPFIYQLAEMFNILSFDTDWNIKSLEIYFSIEDFNQSKYSYLSLIVDNMKIKREKEAKEKEELKREKEAKEKEELKRSKEKKELENTTLNLEDIKMSATPMNTPNLQNLINDNSNA